MNTKNSSWIENPAWVFLLFLGACFILYGNILDNGFVWDDRVLIVGNENFRDWHNIPAFFTEPFWHLARPGLHFPYFRPMVPLSIFLVSLFSGENPLGYHLTGIVLYAVLTFLFYLLLKTLCPEKKIIFPAALLFLVHPVHVESAAWACGASNLLAYVFFLAALLCSLRIRQNRGSPSILLGGVLLFYILGQLSYILILMLPVTVFLIDLLRIARPAAVPLGKKNKSAIAIEYCGYIIISIIFLLIHRRFAALSDPLPQWENGHPAYVNVLFTGQPLEWLLGPLNIVSRYTENLFFPFALPLDPYFPAAALQLSSILCLALFLLSAGLYQKTIFPRLFLFSWLWTLASFAPLAQIKDHSGHFADRYLFITSMGFVLCLALLWNAARHWLDERSRHGKAAAAVLLCLLLAGYGMKTIQQAGYWQNDIIFWYQASRLSPEKPRPRHQLGLALHLQGNHAAAIEVLREAAELMPDWELPYLALAEALQAAGRPQEAQAARQKAASLKPSSV